VCYKIALRMLISTAQIRAARGLLNWSQSDLADRTGISATSIGSIENGNTHPREQTLVTIQRVLERAGVDFLPDQGVRVRQLQLRTFSGRQGFIDFYDDIYETLKADPGEVFVSNVDEREFVKWLGDYRETHVDRMISLQRILYKILIREGDEFMPASSYARYRWMPKSLFSSVPFYVYGKKMALLLFGAEPTVILINAPEIADAYRVQFIDIWDRSKPVEHGDAL
jgi:transcriptional regulator with XRE-family HTH domain